MNDTWTTLRFVVFGGDEDPVGGWSQMMFSFDTYTLAKEYVDSLSWDLWSEWWEIVDLKSGEVVTRSSIFA